MFHLYRIWSFLNLREEHKMIYQMRVKSRVQDVEVVKVRQVSECLLSGHLLRTR